MKQVTSFFVLLSLLVTVAGAEQVYRSVDDRGHVTFSDEPPSGAVNVRPVDVPAVEPSEARVEAAKARTRQAAALADEMREQRLQREAAARDLQRTEPAGDNVEIDAGSGQRDYVWGLPVREYRRRRQKLRRKMIDHGWEPGSGRPGRPPQARPLPARPVIGGHR